MSSDGKYWLTRMKSQCILYDEQGNQYDLVEFLKAQDCDEIDKSILLGVNEKVPCRLLAVRVPDEIARDDVKYEKMRVVKEEHHPKDNWH